jgi:hypothetical protein
LVLLGVKLSQLELTIVIATKDFPVMAL